MLLTYILKIFFFKMKNVYSPLKHNMKWKEPTGR